MAQREEIPSTKLLIAIGTLFSIVSINIVLFHSNQLFLLPKLLLISIVLYYVLAEVFFEWRYNQHQQVKFFIPWLAILFLFIFYALTLNYLLDIPNAFYQNIEVAQRGALIALVLLPVGFTLSRFIHLRFYPMYKHTHDKYHQLLYYMFLYPFGAFLFYFLLSYIYIVFLLSTT